MINNNGFRWSRIILTGLFLYSFVHYFSSYWLSVTKWIVLLALVVVCVTEMFPLKRKWMQRLLQLFAVTGVVAFFVEWTPRYPPSMTWIEIWNFVVYHVLQLSVLFPYIWFAIGTWLIYLLVDRWLQSKWKILIAILVGAISLAFIDTYTAQSLQFDVVIMVCSGLLLLVVHHFHTLSMKSPDSWTHMKEYPGNALTPILVLVSISVLIGTFAPDVKPLLNDPYTVWMNYTGEGTQIARYIEESQRVSSAQSGDRVSGYSRDDSQLGGSFNFDYSAFMTVQTSFPQYMRGETLHYYTGQGWMNVGPDESLNDLLRTEESIDEQEDWNFDLPAHPSEDRSLLETREVILSVELAEAARDDSHPVVFGAFIMESIEFDQRIHSEDEEISLEPIGDFLTWYPGEQELHFEENDVLDYPKSYEVVSQVPIIDEQGLRQVEPLNPTSEMAQMYLQLPDELPERVSELAREITENEFNTYDQIRAIESYLRETYEYNTQPNEDLGQSDDFVDRFLFEVQEGYCDYFSTSMVVLLRSLDIPTRWVKGFTQGSLDDFFEEVMRGIDQGGLGIYNIYNANAHSWVEVYFEGYGWIPFEPTPAFSMPRMNSLGETITFDQSHMEQSGSEDESEFNIGVWIMSIFSIIGAIGIGFIVWSIWSGKRLVRWIRRLRFKKWNEKQPHVMSHRIVLEFERLLDDAHRKGYVSHGHETINEISLRWMKQNRRLQADLQRFVRLFEKAKYSNEHITLGEFNHAQQMVRNMKDIIKQT